ncbi:NAD-binding protein [Paludicola sp. MB14-C6]|uniref:potassium channel family protein n=1 Tax=Paludihabitans sp. MB14-C6 TaxID=3070656 RepID=UPI0027DE8767|nr:NAD-binding protein [Paludicola sp. MB14-C6]WMJ23815.1 NAD-binding protein [Paludicola sp. MB14-C6]
MNILVVGCGKVGSKLASQLSREGHDVSIVDREEKSFELLEDDFQGFKTSGIPIDQDVLKRAGIESCDALAAVSSDDNVNIMVSQLAHEIFQVPTVLARIYDPKREDVFSHFGLHTVCPTNLTVAAVRSAITEKEKPQVINIDCHTISFSTEELPKSLIGKNANEIMLDSHQSLYAIQHQDLSLTLYQGQKIILAAGDKVIISHIVD